MGSGNSRRYCVATSHARQPGRRKPMDRRTRAAGHAEAVPALAQRWTARQVPRVREAIMTALMRDGDRGQRGGDTALSSFAGCGHRAAAIESLQALPDAIMPFMAALFGDDDPMYASSRLNWRATCRRRKPPGYCAACSSTNSIPTCAPRRSMCWRKLGRREAIPALEVCAERFSDTPFLPFAVSIAIARIWFGRLERNGRPEGHESRSVHITPEEVQRLCEFLYRRTGMSFDRGQTLLYRSASRDRIAATGSSSFQAYFSLLRADADMKSSISINVFTVNETYFYREDHQLRCMTSRPSRGHRRAQAAGRHDPHMVDTMLDRRRALFDRHLADGELDPGRQL